MGNLMAIAKASLQQDRNPEQERLSIIQALANETRQPVDDVNRIYAETFERLDADARIKDYLIVLTSKNVRDTLLRSG
jgi:hypothetical protein